VLDWAKVNGYRDGLNPARWRGHLDQVLPKRSKVAKVEHHAAMAFAKVPAFVKELRAAEGNAARALEFTILCASRTGETIGAVWSEIDLLEATWTIPAKRMKAKREHRVPLSPRVIAILEGMKEQRGESDYVFPGMYVGEPLSNMAMAKVLDRMKRNNVTVHGFRSSFRDWAAERTNFPREVAEMALAHTIPSAVEASYRRGDLFEKRRRLMEAWAEYVESGAVEASVTPIRAAKHL
jgi:integrase